MGFTPTGDGPSTDPARTMPNAPAQMIQSQSRAMFTRVLAAWASDLLALRRSGLIVPSAREGAPDPVMRFPAQDPDQHQDASVLLDRRWAAPANALRWRPTRRAA